MGTEKQKTQGKYPRLHGTLRGEMNTTQQDGNVLLPIWPYTWKGQTRRNNKICKPSKIVANTDMPNREELFISSG